MIVDSSRPQVCAACLWMYKAFLRLGFGCHGLFQSAFLHLFRKTKGKSGQQELADALNSVLFALTGCEDMSALAKPEELATATLTSSDIPVAKVQGVRASKACNWIARPTTATEILAAVVSTEPVERLSCWFLQSQSRKTWLHVNPCERPLVNMATRRYSPASTCVHQMVQNLLQGLAGPLAVFDGTLAKSLQLGLG